jgi:hypothetical protein
MVRAKLTVSEVTEFDNNNGGKRVKLTCVYDESIPEDRSFSKFTPNGSIDLYVNNPRVTDVFRPGKKFYVDFTEVEQ